MRWTHLKSYSHGSILVLVFYHFTEKCSSQCEVDHGSWTGLDLECFTACNPDCMQEKCPSDSCYLQCPHGKYFNLIFTITFFILPFVKSKEFHNLPLVWFLFSKNRQLRKSMSSWSRKLDWFGCRLLHPMQPWLHARKVQWITFWQIANGRN